jgi:hypothetical protein
LPAERDQVREIREREAPAERDQMRERKQKKTGEREARINFSPHHAAQ